MATTGSKLIKLSDANLMKSTIIFSSAQEGRKLSLDFRFRPESDPEVTALSRIFSVTNVEGMRIYREKNGSITIKVSCKHGEELRVLSEGGGVVVDEIEEGIITLSGPSIIIDGQPEMAKKLSETAKKS